MQNDTQGQFPVLAPVKRIQPCCSTSTFSETPPLLPPSEERPQNAFHFLPMSDLPPDNLFHSVFYLAGYLPLLLQLRNRSVFSGSSPSALIFPRLASSLSPLHHKSEFLLVGSTVVQTARSRFSFESKNCTTAFAFPAPVEYNSAQGRKKCHCLKCSLPCIYFFQRKQLPRIRLETLSSPGLKIRILISAIIVIKKLIPNYHPAFFEISIHFS